jgi:hypothetical protein
MTCFSRPAFSAKIYKWVDEHGVTQFSTHPPMKQKPGQVVTTVKGIGTASRQGSLSREDLLGTWFTIENRKKHTLSFYKSSFNYRPQLSKTAWGLASAGTWKVNDGMLELTYSQHNDKSKKGTTEQFFVKKNDDYNLTLIAKEGNRRVSFRKDTDELRGQKAISRLAQELIGYWQGVGDGDSIQFSNETFELIGKRKKKFSTNIYDAVDTKYKGRWSVDDPYINLEITLDEVYELEKIRSKVGQQWRWVIVKHDTDTLTVRDTQTRRLKRFVKSGKP